MGRKRLWSFRSTTSHLCAYCKYCRSEVVVEIAPETLPTQLDSYHRIFVYHILIHERMCWHTQEPLPRHPLDFDRHL